MLALAANAEEYWTTREIADFVGRSTRQVYRILAKHRCPTDRVAPAPSPVARSSSTDPVDARGTGAPATES